MKITFVASLAVDGIVDVDGPGPAAAGDPGARVAARSRPQRSKSSRPPWPSSKAMADKLAAAKTMSFTAVATYESPGAPRPAARLHDSLRGDGATTEQARVISQPRPALGVLLRRQDDDGLFPGAELVAVAERRRRSTPCCSSFQPVGDLLPVRRLLVADPIRRPDEPARSPSSSGSRRGRRHAHRYGRRSSTRRCSRSSGSVPRTGCRAWRSPIFLEDPARYRHTVQFSDWKIDPPLAADAFAFTAPAGTIRIPFAPPGATEKGK